MDYYDDSYYGDDGSSVGFEGGARSLAIANQAVVTVTLVVLMVGMGCTMTTTDVRKTFKKPAGIIIGACCQFILMPFLGWSLAHIFTLPPELALGMLSVATCPGGAFSNLLTYWVDGDTCLSVCMTTCSTVIAIGMMPFNLFVYSRSWSSTATVIPYVDIVIALILLLLPCLVGMLIRWKFPQMAEPIAKMTGVVAMIGMIAIVCIIIAMNPRAWLSSWRAFIVAICYPLVGCGLGYVIAYCFRQGNAKCRTIAFETGVQNSALSLTVLNLMLTKGVRANVYEMMVIPSIHGTAVVLEFAVMALSYRIYLRRQEKAKKAAERKKAINKKVEDWAWSPDAVKFAYDNPGLGENANSRTSSLERDKDWPDDLSCPGEYCELYAPWDDLSRRPDEPEEEPWKRALKYANSVRKDQPKSNFDQGMQTEFEDSFDYDQSAKDSAAKEATAEATEPTAAGTLGLAGWRQAPPNPATPLPMIAESEDSYITSSSSDDSSDTDVGRNRIRFSIKSLPQHETEI